MFRNRTDAAEQLAAALKGRTFHQPLVLGIPRGGVVLGAVLARELHAGLDVVLARKLRAPNQPEFALGAVSELGKIYLNFPKSELTGPLKEYLAGECRHQLDEIARRRSLFRESRPPADVAGRSVIVTDDGIATGATMTAALSVLRNQHPRELLVAVPVASPERLDEVRPLCDDVVCLLAPENFHAIGQFYEDFTQVDDREVIDLLRADGPAAVPAAAP
jgi:predicted phosphoribosyltransferase